MDDGGQNILRGAGQLWYGEQLLADVQYELRQSTDPKDPISIRGRVSNVPEDRIRALFGKRLTLCMQGGETGTCFFADASGEIILTVHGFHCER
jgi:hypothetical protein